MLGPVVGQTEDRNNGVRLVSLGVSYRSLLQAILCPLEGMGRFHHLRQESAPGHIVPTRAARRTTTGTPPMIRVPRYGPRTLGSHLRIPRALIKAIKQIDGLALELYAKLISPIFLTRPSERALYLPRAAI